jgi:hypothetical protein
MIGWKDVVRGLLDGYGGRCHEPDAGSSGERRDDLGGSRRVAGLDREIWRAARALTDWKNVYKRKATPAEQLRGKVPLTQFGRMCQNLGTGILAASSPQAKGRVERNHGIHQDRIIKELRRKGIASYRAANQFLEKEYLPQHNRRFARVPAKPEDYHERKPTARELRQIFRLETERRISNDWVLRHEGRYLQLQPAGQRRYGPTQQGSGM